MRKGLENVSLTEQIEGKKSKEKQRVTYLVSMSKERQKRKWMVIEQNLEEKT